LETLPLVSPDPVDGPDDRRRDRDADLMARQDQQQRGQQQRDRARLADLLGITEYLDEPVTVFVVEKQRHRPVETELRPRPGEAELVGPEQEQGGREGDRRDDRAEWPRRVADDDQKCRRECENP
jgi:hypothetical protein